MVADCAQGWLLVDPLVAAELLVVAFGSDDGGTDVPTAESDAPALWVAVGAELPCALESVAVAD